LFLCRRPETLSAATGVCLGALLVPEALYIVTVTLIVCAVLLVVRKQIRRWMALMAVACSYAVAAALFRTRDITVFMTAVLECLIALVLVYVLHNILSILLVHKKRSVFSAEETICLAFGALTLVCITGPLAIRGVFAAYIVAELLVLFTAFTGGAALGAGVGLALGLALCLGISSEAVMIGMLGISGMAAGLMRRLKKGGASVSFLLACLLFILAFYSAPALYLRLIEAAVACAIFAALPRRLFLFAGRYLDIQTRREFDYNLHEKRLRELTVERLKEVSAVFAQTGDMFSGEAAPTAGPDDISDVLSVVAESTCKNCVFRNSCWNRDFLNTYQVFFRMFTVYEKKGALAASDIDAVFAKKCFNLQGILSAAESMFGAYLLSAQWRRKVEASRAITGRQLKGVARVVCDIGREMDTGFQFLKGAEEKVAASLDAAGIRVREVCAESAGGSLGVMIRVRGCKRDQDCRRCVERAVSVACGFRMELLGQAGCGTQKSCTLRLAQAHRYSVLTGIARASKGEVSGDSHSFQGLKNGRYMLMLSDGMGSGQAAQKESAATVSLTENFYQAGFDDSVVFDTINRLLLLRDGEEMFSTVDLCMLDLKTGGAAFTKIGAECSYVFTGSDILTITPGSPPLGILDEVTPISTQMTLGKGDMIVMMSDGATAAIKGNAADWFADIPKENAQETADAILKRALGGESPADDMTVMVSRIIAG
jgi:stage II sporulation protein E